MSEFTSLEKQLLERVEFLEARTICDSKSQKELKVLGKTHVRGVIGINSPDFRKAIGMLWKDYRKFFDIRSYRDTLLVHYELAVQFINEWSLKEKAQKLL